MKIAIAIFFVGAIFYGGLALQCYECPNPIGNTCVDAVKRECPSYQNSSCINLYYAERGLVWKQCLSEKDEHQCETSIERDGVPCILCKNDLCNDYKAEEFVKILEIANEKSSKKPVKKVAVLKKKTLITKTSNPSLIAIKD